MILAFFRKPMGWAVGALIVVLALWWCWSALTRDARTEARLGRNQAEAAAQSGSDAVNTVGKAGEREAASNDLTRTNSEEIHNAEGAAEMVNPAVGAAGLQALCRRAAYRDTARCVGLRK